MPDQFCKKLICFYQYLKPPDNLPKGIDVLFPQQNKEVMKVIKTFFKKFYSDTHSRRMILGINPGRFGAGITGINFTAPKQLKENCKINHPFKISSELSAEFIYEVIEVYGGVNKFFKEWFIGAVCPLGFITHPNPSKEVDKGKNINYYDDKKLQQAVTPFIIESISKQIDIGFKTDFCICVGGEKNFKFLYTLNTQYSWFKEIIPLPHPRFILQYRRRKKENYVRQYLSALQADR
jgi:hypothetical protein